MVSFDQISFGKNVATRHAVIEVLHVGKGVPVGYGDYVQVAVVAAGAPGAVFFGYQVQRGRPRRVGAFSMGEKLLLGDAVLERVQPPGAGEHGGSATCVDVVHNARV